MCLAYRKSCFLFLTFGVECPRFPAGCAFSQRCDEREYLWLSWEPPNSVSAYSSFYSQAFIFSKEYPFLSSPDPIIRFCARGVSLTISRILETGFRYGEDISRAYQTYESNVEYILRFMIDCKVAGANWIEIPPNSYSIRSSYTSYCQLEIDVAFVMTKPLRLTSSHFLNRYENLISHGFEGQWSNIAPLRILSFGWPFMIF